MEYIDFDEAPEIDPDDEFLMEEEPDIPEMEEDDFDADIQNESNIRNASTLNTNKNTNVNNDFNEIESPEPSFTIHASKPYGFQNNAIFKKQVVKDDLLSDLMGIREKSLSMHPAVNMADSTSASSLNMDLFTQQDGLVRKCRDSSTYLLSRPVEKGNTLTSSHNDVLLYKDQLTCTVGNQSRYFLKYRKPISEKLISSGTLLTMPMAVLMEEAQEKEIQSRLAKEKVLKETEADMLDSKANLSRVPTKETNKLWVEKYAPKNFTQLLSVEKTNREVLKAVKAWDKFVFRSSVGDNKKTTSTGNDTAVTEHDNTSRKRERDDLSDDSDEEVIPMKEADKIVDLRPQHKVVMLCGPPGSGKTTLAHVIASHCGYNVIEVNASDDRSCAVLKDKITRSIQSNTINFNTNGNSLTGPGTATVVAEGGDGMPNCIILDEIDGIDNRDTVDMICNLIKAPLKQGKGKKKGESAVALTRPLICVCNDQYSPQLRELRKHSLVFNFNTPMETRLVQRLKQIMSLEGVELSTNVLMTLCDANGNDIRSCLNTLQFATLQSTQKVECEEKNAFEVNSARRKMMVSTTVHEMIKHGLKDEQKNAFQIWKIIFSLSDAASVTNPVDRSVNTFTSKPDRKCVIKNADIGTYLRSIIDQFGDMELLMHGIHENMLKVPYTDPCMSKTSNAMDWLSYTDQISPGHSGSGVHTIHYLAPACIAIHMLCSIDNRAKVEWPRKDRNAFLKKQESNSILQNLMDNSYALSRNRNSCLVSSKQVMVLDVVSHLVTIIHPRVRSHISNMYTLSPLEKYIFEGMTFIETTAGQSSNKFNSNRFNKYKKNPQQNDNSDTVLRLEPNICQLVNSFCRPYKAKEVERDIIGIVLNDIRKVPYMSMDIRSLLQVNVNKCIINIKTKGISVDSKPVVPASTTPIKSHVASTVVPTKPSVSVSKKHASASLDGFFTNKKRPSGAACSVSEEVEKNKKLKPIAKVVPIHFRYSKGCTNAVRRTVRINEFC